MREYITTSNLYWGHFDFSELKMMPIEENELNKCTAVKGDLLICEGGDAGRSAIWDSEHSICFQNHIHRVRPFGKISTYFLFYFMYLIYLNREIKQYLKGVGIQSLSGDSLSSIIIPLPPLAEQQRIVTEIERLFALIDTIEESRLSLEQLVKQAKSKVLDLAIRGKLVPQNPEDEPASVLLERVRKAQKGKSTTADTSHYPFEVPASWEWCNLSELSNQITDGTHKTPKYIENGIPFLRVTDITGSNNSKKFITSEEHNELIKRCNPKKGDILLSKNGTIGVAKVVDWDYDFSIFVSLCLIKPKNLILNTYLCHYLSSDNAIKQMKLREKTVTITNLHLEEIKQLKIALPPLAEQQRIVLQIEKIFALLDEIIKAVET